MRKTTLYLPDDLKHRIGLVAEQRGCTEAAVIREALSAFVAGVEPPPPRLPLFESGQANLAERTDHFLHGFGER